MDRLIAYVKEKGLIVIVLAVLIDVVVTGIVGGMVWLLK